MSDNFTVHLVSNVSPGLFPCNNASKFSTNLCDELNLSEGEWEVGVRQMMYPTRVATTSAEDKIHVYKYKNTYRNLLPVPNKNAKKIEDIGTEIDLSPPKSKQKPDMIKHLLNTVNNSVWSKDTPLLKLEYKEKYKKFILHTYVENIVVWMNKDTSDYFGFRAKQHTFLRGTEWTWSQFQADKAPPSDFKIYLCDLSTLRKETHRLTKTWDSFRNEYGYRKLMFNKFHAPYNKAKFGEPCFSFGVFPHEGYVKLSQLYVKQELMKNEMPIAFFHFDSLTAPTLAMQKIYTMDDFELNNGVDNYDSFFYIPDKKGDQSKKSKIAVRKPTTNTIDILKKPVLKNQTFESDGNYIALDAIYVTFYYVDVVDIVRDLEPTPITSIPIADKKEFEKPAEMLPLLNTKSMKYDYIFSYDTINKRFHISIGNDHAMSLSNSLSSILGFQSNLLFHGNTEHYASDFPVLNRAITALYVYSNIVDPVFIGDVKAPLLLTCPFKKPDSINVVHQQEFLNPCYAPLNRARINQIDIAIYDDAGSLIPFVYGKTKLSLDFRRKR